MKLAIFLLGIICSSIDLTHARDWQLVKKEECGQCNNECFEGYQDGKEQYWCCKCEPGKHLQKECSPRYPTTTQCKACVYNGTVQTYTSEYNNATTCDTSKTSCDVPYTRLVSGSRNGDNKCVCQPGTFAADSPDKFGCKPHLLCPAGFGVLTSGNSTHDAVCEKCKEGMCSDAVSATARCMKCTVANTTNADVTILSPVTDYISPPTPQNTTSCGMPSGAIVAVAVGIILSFIAGMVVMRLVSHCIYRRRKKHKRERKRSDGESARNGRQKHPKRTESAKPLLNENSNNRSEDPVREQDEEMSEKTLDPLSSDHAGASSFDTEDPDRKEKDGGEEIVLQTIHHEHPELLDKAAPFCTKKKDPKEKLGNHSESQYRQIFLEKGYTVIHDPDKDGHCQFSAIAFLMSSNERNDIKTKAKEIRSSIVKFLKDHRPRFEGFSYEGTFDEYVSEMSIAKYGDNITLQAASDMFHKIFKLILTTNDDPVLVTPVDASQEEITRQPLLLGYIGENQDMHYVCLAACEHDPHDVNRSSVRVSESDARIESPDQQAEPRCTAAAPPQTSPGSFLLPLTMPTNGNLASDVVTQAPTSPVLEGIPFADGLQQTNEQQEQGNENSHDAEGSVSPEVPGSSPVQPLDVLQSHSEEALDLFKHEKDRLLLSQVSLPHLEEALDSKEYLKAMLYGVHGLHVDTSTADLKSFIRENALLASETTIEDAEEDHAKNQRELRTKILMAVERENGRKLTPRKLLKIAGKYRLGIIYDRLCHAFVELMKEKRNIPTSE